MRNTVAEVTYVFIVDGPVINGKWLLHCVYILEFFYLKKLSVFLQDKSMNWSSVKQFFEQFSMITQ